MEGRVLLPQSPWAAGGEHTEPGMCRVQTITPQLEMTDSPAGVAEMNKLLKQSCLIPMGWCWKCAEQCETWVFPHSTECWCDCDRCNACFRQQLCLTTTISLSVDISYLIRPLYCINNPACLNVGECSGSSSGVSIFVNTIRNSGLVMLYKWLTCC